MSMDCGSCLNIIQTPNIPYWIGTKFSWNKSLIYKKCIELIPEKSCHPTNKIQDFKITVGYVYAG